MPILGGERLQLPSRKQALHRSAIWSPCPGSAQSESPLQLLYRCHADRAVIVRSVWHLSISLIVRRCTQALIEDLKAAAVTGRC